MTEDLWPPPRYAIVTLSAFFIILFAGLGYSWYEKQTPADSGFTRQQAKAKALRHSMTEEEKLQVLGSLEDERGPEAPVSDEKKLDVLRALQEL